LSLADEAIYAAAFDFSSPREKKVLIAARRGGRAVLKGGQAQAGEDSHRPTTRHTKLLPRQQLVAARRGSRRGSRQPAISRLGGSL